MNPGASREARLADDATLGLTLSAACGAKAGAPLIRASGPSNTLTGLGAGCPAGAEPLLWISEVFGCCMPSGLLAVAPAACPESAVGGPFARDVKAAGGVLPDIGRAATGIFPEAPDGGSIADGERSVDDEADMSDGEDMELLFSPKDKAGIGACPLLLPGVGADAMEDEPWDGTCAVAMGLAAPLRTGSPGSAGEGAEWAGADTTGAPRRFPTVEGLDPGPGGLELEPEP